MIDYFPEDFLLVVDESHASIPQIHGMYKGDRSRKETLVEPGFGCPALSTIARSPSTSGIPSSTALRSSRRLRGEWELERSGGVVVEQIIRPTGLVDPEVEVRPVKGQVDDLLAEIREREVKGERVLVTTLTKRMAEDLSEYLQSVGVRVSYMHSDIDTIERMKILRDLRIGRIDVLVGINLLREGLDLPEGFPRSYPGCGQGGLSPRPAVTHSDDRTGRQKRRRKGDHVRGSCHAVHAGCLDETDRRREIQIAHNARHGITPETIRKSVEQIQFSTRVADARSKPVARVAEAKLSYADEVNTEEYLKILEQEMTAAAEVMDFERAAVLRDQIFDLKAAAK